MRHMIGMSEGHQKEIQESFKGPAKKIELCHKHGPTCGHVKVIHGDHIDHIVEGRLHHSHFSHCDDHGSIEVLSG